MSVHEERRGEIDDVLTAFHYQLNNFTNNPTHLLSSGCWWHSHSKQAPRNHNDVCI